MRRKHLCAYTLIFLDVLMVCIHILHVRYMIWYVDNMHKLLPTAPNHAVVVLGVNLYVISIMVGYRCI